jgi:hypothetical protein
MNKHRRRIASAITTLDLHDIARAGKTYDVTRFLVITPLEDQQELARDVVRHWTQGFGAAYNRHRKEAIELITVVASLEQAVGAVAGWEGEDPLIVATDARSPSTRALPYRRARSMLHEENRVMLLLLGTAWGLDPGVIKMADFTLEPVWGGKEYNHLSVRAAAAVILDRLAGR